MIFENKTFTLNISLLMGVKNILFKKLIANFQLIRYPDHLELPEDDCKGLTEKLLTTFDI